MPKFSFVIPCYRSEKTITTMVDEIKSEMAAKRPGDTYVVLVNDCSPDNVWSVIEGLANTEKNVICINDSPQYVIKQVTGSRSEL